MYTGLNESTFIFDFGDPVRVLKENPNFILNNSQYEDVLFCIIEFIELEVMISIDKLTEAFSKRDLLPVSFLMCSDEMLEKVLEAAIELLINLWRIFKNMNMFDIYASGNLTFPFVLTGVVGPNLILIKDNTISSNEVNIYGSHI